MINCRREGGSAVFKEEPKSIKMSVQGFLIDVLGQNVACILSARDFLEHKVLASEAVLDPQIRRCQMADLPQAACPAYPNCR